MAVGTEFIIDQLKYVVLTESGTTGTVSVGAKDTSITGDIIIPETVTNNGITYTVTLLLNESTTGLLVNCSNVTSLYISKTIIGTTNGYTYNLFMGANGLRSINVDPDNQYFSSDNGVLYNKNKTNLIGYPRNKLDSIFNMPDTVEKISNSSIRYMINSPKYVNLSKNINDIEASNFRDCLKLIKLNIPYISNIGNSIIQGNTNLKELSYDAYSLNNNITGLNKLRTLTIGSHVNSASLTQKSFTGCPNIQTVNVDSQYVVDHFKDFFPQITSSTSPLRYVNIGDSVTSIGDSAFLSGSSLREVTLGKNTSITNNNAFYDCNNLKYISKNDNSYISYYSNGLIFRHVPLYELNVSNNNNRDLTFSTAYPKKLNIIGNPSTITINYANTCRNIKLNCENLLTSSLNYDTTLKSITIPKTVIKSDIKSNNSLMSIVFEGNAPTTSSAYTGNYSTCKVYYYQDTIGWESTFGGLNTQKVFRGEVTSGNYTYKFVDGINGTPNVSVRAANNVKLTGSLNVPQTVSIDNVTYTVRYVADNGFENQYNITSFDMHDQYLEIGNNAFKGCSKLESISQTSTLLDIYEGAFDGCSSLLSFTIPDTVFYLFKNTFRNCKNLTTCTISNSSNIYVIEENCFQNCEKLQSINIPNNVDRIQSNTFENCKSLQTVTYGTGLEDIFESAFTNCKNLSSFTATSTNNLKRIKDKAFYNCYALTTPPISAATQIGSYCFYNNRSLTSLTLPSTIDYIKDYAFGNCVNLTTLTNNTNQYADFGNNVFLNCKVSL